MSTLKVWDPVLQEYVVTVQGPAGPTGPTGATGATGAQGPASAGDDAQTVIALAMFS